MSFANVRILLIDNYDSFTYNLVQAFRARGAEVLVYRNDRIEVAEALALEPTHLVISPGPGHPRDAGNSLAMIDAFAERTPILGVCLGHQCIVTHFGGEIVRADRLMHGKTSLVQHDNETLFAGLPAPFEAGRYHSLIASPATLPDSLRISAQTERGEIMGVRHREWPVEGVQFPPASVFTPDGDALMANFMRLECV